MGVTENPTYCTYHRLFGHTIEDCYVLKDKIESMFNNGEIEIEGAKTKASTNMVTTGETTKIPSSNEDIQKMASSKLENDISIASLPLWPFQLSSERLVEFKSSGHILKCRSQGPIFLLFMR